MKILKEIKVPTGEIYTAKGDKGVLEFLTVADYGKDANIKADFLGITRELNGVPNGTPMPLTEKWVITISTQYGCSMNCKFCDVPKVGPGRNVTLNDLRNEITTALSMHPEVKLTARYLLRCLTHASSCVRLHRSTEQTAAKPTIFRQAEVTTRLCRTRK